MGFRFRKSVNLLPGVRLNASKSGFSWTFGGRGASVSVGKQGTFLNSSIPGTGLSNRQRLSSGAGKASTTPGGSSGNTGKAVLAFIGALFLYAMFGKHTPPAAVAPRLQHPIRITGNGINVRMGPHATANSIASVSSSDSVENLGRLDGQWSHVRLRDGRDGYISNKFLEGIAYVAPAKAVHVAAKHLKKNWHPKTALSKPRQAPIEKLSMVSSAAPSAGIDVPEDLATLATPPSSQPYPRTEVTTPGTNSGGSSSGYHTIQTGPRGGHYYINSNGNKTYVKRR